MNIQSKPLYLFTDIMSQNLKFTSMKKFYGEGEREWLIYIFLFRDESGVCQLITPGG